MLNFMKKGLAIVVILLATMWINGQTVVHVTHFGAIPDDNQNDAGPLRQVMAYCRAHPKTSLFFPPGTYDIRDEKAVQLMHEVMHRQMGENPQKVIFTPYYPYVKGLDFNHTEHITVEAYGAVFLCDGWMEPVSIENAKNVTIKGLTIDYKRKPFSEGEIIHLSKDYFDVEFDDRYPVFENMVVPRIVFWDGVKNRVKDETYFPRKVELLKKQVLRIYDNYPTIVAGDLAILEHSFHFRPAILIHEALETVLKDVTIHAQPGMGIVGHRSHNITLDGLRIVPSSGCKMSTNTDATHFTSCTGLISFEGCQFEGHGDDATNVHNYYYTITRRLSENTCEIKVNAPTGTHAQVLDYPDVTNTLELVNKKTLKVVKTVIVQKLENDPKHFVSQITLDSQIPKDIENYLLINATRLPAVRFRNSSINSHLARAILIKTRNVLVENCAIREMTGTAIHIAAEGEWHEGPGAYNVIVRNNRIIHSGRGAGLQNGAAGIAVNVKCENPTRPGIHKNLLFENNIIEGEDAECGIYISCADSVTVQHNEISGCKTPVIVEHSTHISVLQNRSTRMASE